MSEKDNQVKKEYAGLVTEHPWLRLLPKEDIKSFAELTMDFNRMHTDEELSRRGYSEGRLCMASLSEVLSHRLWA